MFYFCSLIFKRSGKYTISFLVELCKSSASNPPINIAPLVYTVTVEAKQLLCGCIGALDRLVGSEYVFSVERQISFRRRELLLLVQDESHNELLSIKKALLTIYLALPSGSLSMIPDEGIDNLSDHFHKNLTEAQGWSDTLDSVWRSTVMNAQSPEPLMECTLVLEYYLNKNWLNSVSQRLLSSLPNAQFAIRCVTCSAVSLRIFCLDKAIMYDKVLKQKTSTNKLAKPTMSSNRVEPTRGYKRGRVYSGSDEILSKRRQSTGEESDEDEQEQEEEDSCIAIHRPRRTAAMRQTAYAEVDSDEDELSPRSTRAGSTRKLRDRPVPPQQQSQLALFWMCPSCDNENSRRARTCEVCGESKPAVRVVVSPVGKRKRGRPRRSTYSHPEEEEEDEDEDEEEDGGIEEEGNEDDEDEDEDEEEVEQEQDEVQDVNEESKSDAHYRARNENESNNEDGGSEMEEGSAEGEEENQDDNDDDAKLDVVVGGLIASRGGSANAVRTDAEKASLLQLRVLKDLIDDPSSEPFWTPVDCSIYVTYR